MKDRHSITDDEHDEDSSSDTPKQPVRRPHLITVDELRAAGALDVPPAWRKSLGGEPQRDLFSDLPWDDDPSPDEQASTPREGGDDDSVGEVGANGFDSVE